MSSAKIIRAWKDVDYRLSLSEAERAQLPDHPAGLTELTEQELRSEFGAASAFLYPIETISHPPVLTIG
jgi:mersacidin/lichenicidin family type 2 lantibiotic